MRKNLDASLGLPMAESLTFALAAKIGREKARHRVGAAVKLALSQDRTLAAVAKGEPAIAGNLAPEEIDRALDPVRYLGSADAMIDITVAEARKLIAEMGRPG
jgi:3-carboxy-cis,cis-muconate cycloisomerase